MSGNGLNETMLAKIDRLTARCEELEEQLEAESVYGEMVKYHEVTMAKQEARIKELEAQAKIPVGNMILVDQIVRQQEELTAEREISKKLREALKSWQGGANSMGWKNHDDLIAEGDEK